MRFGKLAFFAVCALLRLNRMRRCGRKNSMCHLSDGVIMKNEKDYKLRGREKFLKRVVRVLVTGKNVVFYENYVKRMIGIFLWKKYRSNSTLFFLLLRTVFFNGWKTYLDRGISNFVQDVSTVAVCSEYRLVVDFLVLMVVT